MFHDAIAGDAVEIRGEGPTLRVVLPGLTHQGHENVLHDFFRGPGITGHTQGKTIESSLMPPIEGGESVFIPFRSAAQENVVPDVVRNAIVSWCDCSLAW